MKSKIKKIFFLLIIDFLLLLSCSKNNDEPINQPVTIEKPINITIKTIAGGFAGDDVGSSNGSKFRSPSSVSIFGSDLLISDTDNHRIKILINESTLENRCGTGVSGDGIGAYNISQIKYPSGITNWNSDKYFADSGNNKIKKISNLGIVSTAVGEIPYELLNPRGIAFDNEGALYICDTSHNKIKRVAFANGAGYIMQTIAGDVQGDGINFNEPFGIAIDAAKNLYITDSGNYKIKKIDVSGQVTTLAGSTNGDVDGIGANAKFGFINGITIDGQGNLYVSDSGYNKIKKIAPNGKVTSLNSGQTGDFDGNETTAKIKLPKGLSVSLDGKTIYFADAGNHKIKKITIN